MTRHVFMRIDHRWIGSVVVNGMELNHMIRSTRVVTHAGRPTTVEIEFFPEMVTVDTCGMLKAVPVKATATRTTQADEFVRHRKPKGRK